MANKPKLNNRRAPAWLTRTWETIKAIVMAPIALVTRVVERIIMGKKGVEAAERNGSDYNRAQEEIVNTSKNAKYMTQSIEEQLKQKQLNLDEEYKKEMAKPEKKRDAKILSDYLKPENNIDKVFVYPINIGRTDVCYGVKITLKEGILADDRKQKDYLLLINKSGELLNNPTCPSAVMSVVKQLLANTQNKVFEESEPTPETNEEKQEEVKPKKERSSKKTKPDNGKEKFEEPSIEISYKKPEVEEKPGPTVSCHVVAQRFIDTLNNNGKVNSLAMEYGKNTQGLGEETVIAGSINEKGIITLTGKKPDGTVSWSLKATRDDAGIVSLEEKGDASLAENKQMRNILVEATAEISCSDTYKNLFNKEEQLKMQSITQDGTFISNVINYAREDIEKNTSRSYIYGGTLFTSKPNNCSIDVGYSGVDNQDIDKVNVVVGKKPDMEKVTRTMFTAYTENLLQSAGIKVENNPDFPSRVAWSTNDGRFYIQSFVEGGCSTYSWGSDADGISYYTTDKENNSVPDAEKYYPLKAIAVEGGYQGYAENQAKSIAQSISGSKPGPNYYIAGNMCVSIEQTGRNKTSLVVRKLDAKEKERETASRSIQVPIEVNDAYKMIRSCANELQIPYIEQEYDKFPEELPGGVEMKFDAQEFGEEPETENTI